VTGDGALSELLGAVVRVGTVRVGDVSGVFVDATGARAIGLEVAGAGGVRRFLPWVAAKREEDVVSVASALFLVDDGASYERLGARAIRDASVLGALQASPEGHLEPPAVSARSLAGTTER
jgi:hypothetical protein